LQCVHRTEIFVFVQKENRRKRENVAKTSMRKTEEKKTDSWSYCGCVQEKKRKRERQRERKF
jgi:hypothetical protein